MTRQEFIAVRARSTDPDTAHEAAVALEHDQPRLQRSVGTVVTILTDSPFPLSDFQIRERWSDYWVGPWSFTLPSKARHWAREQGLVRHDGYGTNNGRRVRLWGLGEDEEFRVSALESRVRALVEGQGSGRILLARARLANGPTTWVHVSPAELNRRHEGLEYRWSTLDAEEA